MHMQASNHIAQHNTSAKLTLITDLDHYAQFIEVTDPAARTEEFNLIDWDALGNLPAGQITPEMEQQHIINPSPRDHGHGYNATDRESHEQFTRLTLEGTPCECQRALLHYALSNSHIPTGDDSVYDYWPSNFSALTHLCLQLDAALDTEDHIEIARSVWDNVTWGRAIADNRNYDLARTQAEWAEEVAPRP